MTIKKFMKEYGLNALTIIAVALAIFLNFTEMGMQIQKGLIAERPGLFYWFLTPFMIGTVSLWFFTKLLKLKIKVTK